jgi:hypothetical protein
MSNNPLIIYWSPADFAIEETNWNLFYSNPEPVSNILRVKKNKDTKMNLISTCPAVKDRMSNLFVFRSNHEDTFEISSEEMEKAENTTGENIFIPSLSMVGIKKSRTSPLEGFYSIEYNMSWIFFAEEPVTIKITAPYYPAESPVPGGLFAPGEYDISKWYRPIPFEYLIPKESKEFSIKFDQQLFYVEVITDRKVEFKRYKMTSKLKRLYTEAMKAPNYHGKWKDLASRYLIAERSGFPKIVMSEIRQNLID